MAIVTSFENVLAVAAAAGGQMWLNNLGLIISIPLVVFGATAILALLTRNPVLVWATAGRPAQAPWSSGEGSSSPARATALKSKRPSTEQYDPIYGDRAVFISAVALLLTSVRSWPISAARHSGRHPWR